MSSIDSLKSSSIGETTAKAWEKTVTDVNDIDESLANARDLGQTRLNYSRLTAIGQLSGYDSVDIYKTTVVSQRGKLAISLRNASGSDEKVLDLSKYETYLNELKKQTDPEGYAKEQEEKQKELENQNSLDLTAPGMKIEVYMTNKQGKQILIGDSSAEKGTKTREALEQMLSGEYMASQGEYYIKVSRSDEISSKEEIPYALQIRMGDTFKHDYIATETASSDTKNKTTSKIPSTGSNGLLSSVNALEIQATRYQATAQMLEIGYLNMADIYNKNNKLF